MLEIRIHKYCLYKIGNGLKVGKYEDRNEGYNHLVIACDFQYHHEIKNELQTGNGNYFIILKDINEREIPYIEFNRWKASIEPSVYEWGGHTTGVKFIDKNNTELILRTVPRYSLSALSNFNDKEFPVIEDIIYLIVRVSQCESVEHYKIQEKINKSNNLLKGSSLEEHESNIKKMKDIKDDIIAVHTKRPFSKEVLESFRNSICKLAERVGLSIDEIEWKE